MARLHFFGWSGDRLVIQAIGSVSDLGVFMAQELDLSELHGTAVLYGSGASEFIFRVNLGWREIGNLNGRFSVANLEEFEGNVDTVLVAIGASWSQQADEAVVCLGEALTQAGSTIV